MVAPHEPQAGVVNPPSGRVPADRGLAALGLLMQLAGRTTGGLAALVASLALLALLARPLPRHAAWFGFAIALCVARSQLHRIAGRELCHGRRGADGSTGDPFTAMRWYVVVGLGHAIAIGGIAAGMFHAPRPAAAGIAAALALWPGVLALVSRAPRLRPLRAGIPPGDDRGLESASILLIVLGAHGVLAVGAVRGLAGALSPHQRQHGWGVMLTFVGGLLAVRSALHVRAGLAGLVDGSFDRPGERADRYAAFAMLSAVCIGGVLALLAMSEQRAAAAIPAIAVTGGLLVSWPLTVKRFFHQRRFAELLAGDRARHRRAPDLGLTGLGWLLAGHATLLASLAIAQLAVRAWPGDVLVLGGSLERVRSLTGLADGAGWPGNAALGAVVVALELAAAVALIRMHDAHRAVAAIYALCAGIIAAGSATPVLRAMGQHPGVAAAIQLLPLAIQLVIPTATLVLVRRAVAPAARAHYRRNTRSGATVACAAPRTGRPRRAAGRQGSLVLRERFSMARD